MRLLVVIGEGAPRRELEETLDGLGLDVAPRWVASAELDVALRDQSWDAVVACEGGAMPDVSDLVAAVRRGSLGTPVVVLAAASGMDRAVALMKAGAADVLAWERRDRLGAVLGEATDGRRDPGRLAISGLALHELLVDAGGEAYDYRFLAVNAAFEAQTGLSASAIVGRTVREVIPDIEPYWIETYGAVVRSGEPRRFEQFSAPLGRWYLVMAHRAGPGQFVTEFVDITDRKQAEEALARNERRYRELVDDIDDGIFETDTSGRLTFASRALGRIHGCAPEELVGRRFQDTLDPAMRDAADALFLHALARGKPAGLVTMDIVRDDGTRATVEIRPAVTVEEGRVVGTRGVVRDVSEHLRAERSAARLGEMFRAVADPVVVTNAAGIIELVNPAFERVSGYTAAEAVGQTPRILKSGEHPPAFYERLWSAILAGDVFRTTFANRRKSGELYHQDETITPIRDEAGRITHFVSTGRDVTERLALEQQLHRARRLEAVGQLAGGVAHDFNNLLTVITNFAHFAKEGLAEAAPARADIEQIEAASRRASELTGQLLAFARRQPVAPKVISLRALIDDTARMLRRLVGDHVELVVVPAADDPWPVCVDPGALEHVLVNLAVNARDAMPAGGILTIELGRRVIDEAFGPSHGEEVPAGDYVLLTVSDTGVGIPVSIRERIFEPFFTTKAQGKGTGLGLSTCYGLVKQAGGHISVYSEPGQGTSFHVYLPRADRPLDAAGDVPRVEDPSGTETVLLVEDEEQVRVLAARALRRYGYEVLEAAHGAEALLVAERHAGPIALLLTDVVMPKMSGRELAERLVALRPALKVLYMSGYTANAIVHNGVLAPGTRLLPKPFGPQSLARMVRQVLDEP